MSVTDGTVRAERSRGRSPTAAAEADGAGRVGVGRRSRFGRSRRSALERVTPAMVVGLVLSLLAFVLVAAVLRDRREMTTALVPVRVIAAGEPVTGELVEVVEVPASVSFTGGLITKAELAGGSLVAGRPLLVGEPITRSSVGPGSGRAPSRVIALPLDAWGAAGGELEVGDQVDVIDTRADVALFVVQAAVVVERSSGSIGGGLAATSSGVWVSIEVSAEQALAIAAVIEANKFVVVRSTGVAAGS